MISFKLKVILSIPTASVIMIMNTVYRDSLCSSSTIDYIKGIKCNTGWLVHQIDTCVNLLFAVDKMASKRKQDEKNLKTLRELASREHNKKCFDCGQRGPTYVNMTIGSFVCTSCSGLL